MNPRDVAAHQRRVERTKKRLKRAQDKHAEAIAGLRWAQRLSYLRARALERPITTDEEGQDEFVD